jgi:hypothetical protein
LCGERGGSSLRLCAALEDDEHADSNERHERRDGPVDAASTPRASLRLFDQRLDEGLEILADDGIARARGRGGAVTLTAELYRCASDQASQPALRASLCCPLPSAFVT